MEAQHSKDAYEHAAIPAGGSRRNTYIFFAAIVVALLLAVYFRAPLFNTYGFYEPDGYFHFSVIREAVLHGFALPQNLSISGWPYTATSPRIPHHEPFGLYWVTLVPYFLLQFAGISYYDIMRLVPVLFGILDVFGAYFLARYLSKDKLFGLLVMLFVALNMGNAARTSATIYRGDSFIAIFLLLALILTIAVFKSEDKRRKWLFTFVSGILLSICNLVWTGAAFATAVYFFAFMLIAFLGFTFDNKRLVKESAYMLAALPIWWFLVQAYTYLKWIVTQQTFTGLDFWYVFIPLAVGWYAIDYLVNKRPSHIAYLDTPQKRFAASLFAFVVAFLFVYIFVPSLINDIFVSNGLASSSAFGTTIQEQQLPSYSFIFASFGFQTFTTPMSIMMIIATLFSTDFLVPIWLIIMALLGVYLFMHVEREQSGLPTSGRVRFRLEFDETMLIIIAYFGITAYLQMNAIRFNSLLSIPISILGAYTIYWFLLLLKERRPSYNPIYLIAIVLALSGSATAFLYFYSGSSLGTVVSLLAVTAISVFIASIACVCFEAARKRQDTYLACILLLAVCLLGGLYFVFNAGFTGGLVKTFIASLFCGGAIYLIFRHVEKRPMPYIVSCAAVALLIAIILVADSNYVTGLLPADQINPSFIQALSWLNNNSASNSVVLTLWPDGSLVEGVANRTSVTDSVGSQYAYKANPFAAWLYDSSADPAFLLSNLSGKPDYLLVRAAWMNEAAGIFTESGINVTSSSYGFDPFTSLNESVNRTVQAYRFFGSGLEEDTVISNTSGTQTIASYLRFSNGIQPFAYVDFYNEMTGTFSIIKQTAFNATNNQTFLIVYSPIPFPHMYVNITGAYMLNTKLANSNMIKFLFHCDSSVCMWDNSVASLKLVYINEDTKIFSIEYNESNSSVQAATAAYPRNPV